MKNRFNRSEFYVTENINGVSEKDFLTNMIRDYSFKKQFITYQLQYEDYMRPDLISKKLYETKDYWWIILRCNPELEDIWNDYGYSDEVVNVKASEIDPSINTSNDYIVPMDKHEYLYPNAFKVGEYINVPTLSDIQDFYTKTRS